MASTEGNFKSVRLATQLYKYELKRQFQAMFNKIMSCWTMLRAGSMMGKRYRGYEQATSKNLTKEI